MADLDEDLVREVDGRARTAYAGRAYRHLGPGHPPTSGEGARIRGGRWNPPESFPVVYLGLTTDTVIGEFYRLAERQGMPAANLLPRRLQEYTVELRAVLDLREPEAREVLGLTDAAIRSEDPSRCQVVGDAAHYAGFEAILGPSATGVGDVLAIFTDRLQAGSSLEAGKSELWRELPTDTGGRSAPC